ncbi:MAG: hydroxyisourate hydrolase [Planctomycetes bacterium]|nr:hydroxyisourate hydrolase [Planctomycetota bacterium]
MSGISTHVLDTSRGLPGIDIRVVLERESAPGQWHRLTDARTDADGRVKTLLPTGQGLELGAYRLTFDTEPYFAKSGVTTFFPSVAVAFRVMDSSRHHHVPLLVSPFGYSTYRGT